MERELIEDARRWVRERMDESAGHDWGHIERVVTNAQRLADEEGADRLVVELAAWMHDVVNLAKDDARRAMASTKSAEAAGKWLEGKLNADRIELVCEAIRCHSFSAGLPPESLEAKVVSDADNLDAIGAIGIARVFEVGGASGRPTLASDDPFCRKREPDDSRFTLDHFYTKLLRLGDRFYTDSGRRQAQQRLRFMRQYLETLKAEVGDGGESFSRAE